jgi:hypothetical protein
MGCGSSTHDPASPQAAEQKAPLPQKAHGHGKDKGETKAGANGSSAAAASSEKKVSKHPSSGRKKGSTEERFEIIKVLGEGASCKVVSAKDRGTGVRHRARLQTTDVLRGASRVSRIGRIALEAIFIVVGAGRTAVSAARGRSSCV